MTKAELTALWESFGETTSEWPTADEFAAWAIKQHLCACTCKHCASALAASNAATALRELLKPMKHTAVLQLGGASLWRTGVSVRELPAQGMVELTIQYSTALSGRGQLLLVPNHYTVYYEAAEGGLFHYSGETSPGAPGFKSMLTAAADGTVLHPRAQWLPYCPVCGALCPYPWTSHDQPSIVVNHEISGQRVNGSTCDQCHAFVPLSEWTLVPAPTEIVVPEWPTLATKLMVGEEDEGAEL